MDKLNALDLATGSDPPKLDENFLKLLEKMAEEQEEKTPSMLEQLRELNEKQMNLS